MQENETPRPDLDFDMEPTEPPLWEERRRRPLWPWVIVALVIVVAAFLYFLYFRPQSGPPAAEEPEPAPMAPFDPVGEVEEEPLADPPPPLDESDPWVRERADALSTHPMYQRLLAGDDLVRRLIVSLLNVAEGSTPSGHLRELAPGEPFAPDDHQGRPVLGQSSYRRYNRLAAMVDSIDVNAAGRLYRISGPLLSGALAELGMPDETVPGAAARALAVVRSTPTPTDPIVLERTVEGWRFADPQLEGLSPAQKQLLRMGPENRNRIQVKLEELVNRLHGRQPGRGANGE